MLSRHEIRMKDSDHRGKKTVTSGTGRGSRKEAVSTMGWLQAGSPQLGPQWTNTMGTGAVGVSL